MDILVKGMEMPTSCSVCWALDDYGDYPRCRITEEQRGYNFPIRQKRMDKCPLISIPPHGDLIERDMLLKGDGRYIISFGKEGIDVAEINRAPTIIPASEEGD